MFNGTNLTLKSDMDQNTYMYIDVWFSVRPTET